MLYVNIIRFASCILLFNTNTYCCVITKTDRVLHKSIRKFIGRMGKGGEKKKKKKEWLTFAILNDVFVPCGNDHTVVTFITAETKVN